MSTTYGEQRTEQEKRIDAQVLARVQRGLAWLEETHGPGWEGKIDLAEFNIGSCDRCILGMIYDLERPGDGYGYASDNVEGLDYYSRRDSGFTCGDWGREEALLQEAWEFVLRPRVTAT